MTVKNIENELKSHNIVFPMGTGP